MSNIAHNDLKEYNLQEDIAIPPEVFRAITQMLRHGWGQVTVKAKNHKVVLIDKTDTIQLDS